MQFTISGHHNGKPASITWNDGELSGDEDAIRALRQLAQEREFAEIVCMPPIPVDGLRNPLASMVLMGQALHPMTGSSGNLPTFPTAPPGAVN